MRARLTVVISRKDVVTDSAIAVVAEQGVRGLTHRAVDAMAKLPVGSTSNVYRTRDALITGVLERIGELNARQLERLADATRTGDRSITAGAVGLCHDLLTTDRNRFYTSVILTLDPALTADALAAKNANLRHVHEFVMHLTGLNSDDTRRLTSSVFGMMVSQLMTGTVDRDHIEAFIVELETWVDDHRVTT